MPSDWLLGIDFGTTNTAAAQVNLSTGVVRVVALSHAGNLMSSSVYVTSVTQIDVGEVASNRAAGDPSRYLVAPKRLLTLGQTMVQVRGVDIPAYLVLAAIFRSVLVRATTQHAGGPPAGLVLTHPESWARHQIQVLFDAANEIGYPAQVVRTVSEPRAAAHYYARAGTVQPGDRVAVFDFGGGTLDVAVLAAASGGMFQVVAAEGDNALGGRNFDAAIRRWVVAELTLRNPEVLAGLEAEGSGRESRALEESIRTAKEVLSEAAHAGIEVSAGGRHESLSLTRPEFEGLIEREVARAVEVARDTFRVAGGGIKVIYLTGGSSRIPLVHRGVAELGPIATMDDPKTVVAQGALAALSLRPGSPAPITVPTPVPTWTPRPASSGFPWRTTAVVSVVAAGIVVAVVLGTVLTRKTTDVVSPTTSSETTLGSSTESTEPSTTLAPFTESVTKLQVGQCVDGINRHQSNTDVTVTDCESPHDAEVLFTYQMTDSGFPGVNASAQEAQSRCHSMGQNRLAASPLADRLTDLYLYPDSQQSWNADKGVICMATDKNDNKLTGRVNP